MYCKLIVSTRDCSGKEQTLPDGSVVTPMYYTVRYNAYPETTEVLNDSSLRVPAAKSDDDVQSAQELAEEMQQLFESVRAQDSRVLFQICYLHHCVSYIKNAYSLWLCVVCIEQVDVSGDGLLSPAEVAKLLEME